MNRLGFVVFLIIGTLAVLFDCLVPFDIGNNCILAGSILPAIITGGASLLGDLFGGLFGSSATDTANQTNLAIARETNQNNYKMFQEQLGFNREMYEDSKRYNSPSQQVQRFRQAGLNPYAMLGVTDNGSVSAMQSPSPNPAIPAHVEPNMAWSESLRDIGNTPSLLYDVLAKKATAEQIGIDNQLKLGELKYQETKLLLELREKRADIYQKMASGKLSYQQKHYYKKQGESLDKQIEELSIRLQYLDQQEQAKTTQQQEDARRAGNEANKAYWESEYQRQLSNAFPAMNRATLNLMSQQAYQAYASGVNQFEQGKTEFKLRPLKVFYQKMENLIKANDVKVSDFGLSQNQLDDLRRKKIIEWRNGSYQFRDMDNFLNWFGTASGLKQFLSK
jgi:hypothetical protein